jgi:hypothetical protein
MSAWCWSVGSVAGWLPLTPKMGVAYNTHELIIIIIIIIINNNNNLSHQP